MELKRTLRHVVHAVHNGFKCIETPRIADAFENLPKAKKGQQHGLTPEQFEQFKNIAIAYSQACDQHIEKYKDEYDIVRHLTYGKFIEDIELALNIKAGYYKSVKTGKCAFIQGIEIDGNCSLLRGGYNAEDYGVYVHWSVVSDNGIDIFNRPIHMFTMQLDPGLVEDYYEESTKEEYEAAVKRMEELALTERNIGLPVENFANMIENELDMVADYRDKFIELTKDFKVTENELEQLKFLATFLR